MTFEHRIKSKFEAHASLPLRDHDAVIAPMCEHMIEHGAEVEVAGNEHWVRLRGATARFRRAGPMTLVDLTAKTLEALYFIRSAVASHIVEFSTDSIDMAWTGDGSEIVRPPNFDIFEVVKVRDVTPRLRRITFSTNAPERFVPLDALHLNLLVQHPEIDTPQWPTVGKNGLIDWPDTSRRPTPRKYTVRSVDAKSGTLDIDFVIHADAGPGSQFAETAIVGQEVGVLGPGGGGLASADWYLFAGDETALPAIARMLEHLPPQSRGVALIEVENEREIQRLSTHASIAIIWLCRSQRLSGGTHSLRSAIKEVDFPDTGTSIFVWAGCEFEDFKSIRAHLREERKLQKHEHLVVAYWRKGMPEDPAG
ncbi:DUF2218 domain-containing protein [Phyllobacterium sp. K27]